MLICRNTIRPPTLLNPSLSPGHLSHPGGLRCWCVCDECEGVRARGNPGYNEHDHLIALRAHALADCAEHLLTTATTRTQQGVESAETCLAEMRVLTVPDGTSEKVRESTKVSLGGATRKERVVGRKVRRRC